jgi:hypothetical protein
MKKMLILALIALFYIVTSALVPSNTVPVDQDVGIVCTIADNHQMPNVVISPCESYQVARGVSVPCKYLMSEAIIFDDLSDFRCYDYHTIQTPIFETETLPGYTQRIDKYPLEILGLRQS